MKVVQVLTFVSADGAYGGPVAVARVQCEYLARLGHEVHLVAGWDGNASLDIPGVNVHLRRGYRLLPGGSFASLASPGVWRTVHELSADADVVHLHFARDLVQLPAGRLVKRGSATVIQAHGMVRPDRRVALRALDRMFVRRAYRRASVHLALTEQEAVEIPIVAGVEVRTEPVR